MTIRTTLLVWTSVLIVLMVIQITGTFSYFLLTNFKQLETNEMTEDISRVHDAITQEFGALDSKILDWSTWDDSYTYVQNHNQAFEKANLADLTLSNLKINFMVFVDSKGAVVYSSGFDWRNSTKLEVPNSVLKDLATDAALSLTRIDDARAGFVMTGKTPVLLVARPILHTDGTGPVAGTLLIGKLLDAPEIEVLAKNTKLDLSILPIDATISQADQSIVNSLLQKKDTGVHILSSQKLVGYGLLNDIEGKPSMFFSVTSPRSIYLQGVSSVRTVVVMSILCGVEFIVALLFLQEWLVLRPLSRVSSDIQYVGKDASTTRKIRPIYGKNELSKLVVSINAMLDSLSLSRKELEAKQKQERDAALQLESRTKALEDNKRAMLNLLEDGRELEHSLAAERDQAASIITSVGEGLIRIDKDAVIRLINPAALRMFNLSEQDVIGQKISDVWDLYKNDVRIPEKDRPIIRTLQTGQSSHLDLSDSCYYQIKSGKRFPVAITCEPIRSGNEVVGSIVAFRDITKDKQEKEIIEAKVIERTQELREEKARFVAAINNVNQGFIIMDLDRAILSTNHTLDTILDKTHDSWTFDELEYSIGSSCDIASMYSSCIARKTSAKASDVAVGKKTLRIFMAPFFVGEDDQQLIGVVMTIDDITEAKILERSRDEFFSIASHELRTPLTAIRGNTSMMLDYYPTAFADPQLREMVNDVHESSIRLIDIVNDFLNVSRLEQRRLTFKNAPFDLSLLIQKALNEYQVSGSRKRLSLLFTPPSTPLPLVLADSDRVREVIINLVGNALKFTEEGGVTVSASVKNNFVEVTVTDTGRGIALANQSLLFHKFQQASESLFTRDTTKGTGLGLYISKLIIEGMGGSIWLAKSEEGKGTVFAFTLPVA